jgi:hypothetical protein
MRLADFGGTAGPQFLLQRPDEGGEDVQHQGTALAENRAQAGIDHGVYDHRALAAAALGLEDGLDRGAGTHFVVDERQPTGAEGHPVKLGQHALADGLGGDAGTVGDVKDRAWMIGHGTHEPCLNLWCAAS